MRNGPNFLTVMKNNTFKGKQEYENFLFGLPRNKFSFELDSLISQLSMEISKRKTSVVISINLHAIKLLQENADFKEYYGSADHIIFDGISAIWLAKLKGAEIVEKISHDFLMRRLYEEGQKEGWSFYFLGGPEGSAKEASEMIKQRFPEIEIAGTHHGYFEDEEEEKIIKEINRLEPDILAVGLGMPFQERWIHNHKGELKVGMITNCGAYIEQTANEGIDYYPSWAYRYQLNWFYRILKEPRRLWKRYLSETLIFIPILFKELIKHMITKIYLLWTGES